MGEMMALFAVITVSAATTAALLVLLPFLIPRRVTQVGQIMQAMPGRSFIIGLVNALFFLVIAAVLAQGGDGGGLLALLLVLALLALAAVGLAGLVMVLRQRIYPQAENVTGMQLLIKTAVLLVAAALLPFLGWFVLAPILLLIGLGAAIMTLVRRPPLTE